MERAVIRESWNLQTRNLAAFSCGGRHSHDLIGHPIRLQFERISRSADGQTRLYRGGAPHQLVFPAGAAVTSACALDTDIARAQCDHARDSILRRRTLGCLRRADR